MKKNALLIRMGPYDMTQALPRSAATLQTLGYAITILSLDRYGDKPAEEAANGWRIRWYHRPYKSGNKLSFFWSWLCWWRWVIGQIRRGGYDLVQASNLESIVPCILAQRFRRFKLVFDVRDPWGMNYANPRHPLMRCFRRMERWAAARVDGMVLSQGILDRTGDYFGPKARKRTPAVQVLNVPGKDMAQGYAPPTAEGVRINFSGHISYVRNAQALIDLAERFPEKVKIDVVGEIRDQRLADALRSLPNVQCFDRLPFTQAMTLLQEANLISVMYDTATEVAVVSSANKMFEAMMMSRPYIASNNGFPGMVAEQYGVGWAVPYGDSAALIKRVEYILDHPEEIQAKARRAREVYESHFTWDKQQANLIALYEYLADGKQVDFICRYGWEKLLGTTS